jgi:hypothetical protein
LVVCKKCFYYYERHITRRLSKKGDTAMPVHKKLNEARIAFHALPLKKSGHNTFAGYKYFELGDFVIPALRIFNDVGLCAVISFAEKFASMSIVDVEDGSQIIIHSPMGSANLKGCHEIQNIGACETYSALATSGRQRFASSSMMRWMPRQARANQSQKLSLLATASSFFYKIWLMQLAPTWPCSASTIRSTHSKNCHQQNLMQSKPH